MQSLSILYHKKSYQILLKNIWRCLESPMLRFRDIAFQKEVDIRTRTGASRSEKVNFFEKYQNGIGFCCN